MMVEWLEWRRDGWVLKLILQPKTVKIGASYWSRAKIRGLWLVERTFKKKSKGFALIRKCPSMSTWLNHSDLIQSHPSSFQSSSEREVLIWMEWRGNEVEWGQNDLIQCCLLIGDSTGLNHSDLIQSHSSSFQSIRLKEEREKFWSHLNDWGMMGNGVRMI